MDENRIDETRKYEENGFAVEPESGEIVVEGLTVEEAGKVKEIWKRFIRAYKESDGDRISFGQIPAGGKTAQRRASEKIRGRNPEDEKRDCGLHSGI